MKLSAVVQGGNRIGPQGACMLAGDLEKMAGITTLNVVSRMWGMQRAA